MQHAANQEHTDVAALAAAALAIIIAADLGPGPYGVMNLVFSVTLITLLYAYLGSKRRDRSQSLAVSTIFALAFTPAFGFFDEALKRGDILGAMAGYDDKEPSKSRIGMLHLHG